MKAVSVRHFHTNVRTIAEPVEIVTFDRETGAVITLGYYYPKGTEPSEQQTRTPITPSIRKTGGK